MCWLPLQFGLSRWCAMWVIAVTVYMCLKSLSWHCRSTVAAPVWKHVAYLIAWPGMDVEAFLYGARAKPPSMGEWVFAVAKMLSGLALLAVAFPVVEASGATVGGWLALLGLALSLHFGTFHILACLWRALGIDAVPIMNWPVRSRTLAEFWGQRWNLAFRDLTNRFVFLPLAKPLGSGAALFAAFLVSGLIHDLVISLPAGGGYGLPTLYFTIQGLATLVQRSWPKTVSASGISRRLVTLASVTIPLPLLFHAPFIHRVVVPFLQAAGAS